MIRPTDGRLRLIYVPERDVLDWFANAASKWIKRQVLELPIISGLPEDTSVVAVHHDIHRRAFQFTIRSAMFSEVPCGEEIPGWEGSAPMRYEVVELRTDINDEDKAAIKRCMDEMMDRTNIMIPRHLRYPTGGEQYIPERSEPIEMQTKALADNGPMLHLPGAGGLPHGTEPAPPSDPDNEADAMMEFFKR